MKKNQCSLAFAWNIRVLEKLSYRYSLAYKIQDKSINPLSPTGVRQGWDKLQISLS